MTQFYLMLSMLFSRGFSSSPSRGIGKKVDYCSLQCSIGGKLYDNVVCRNAPCTPVPPCELLDESESQEFRSLVLHLHNSIRDKLARQRLGYDLPTAANMYVLNYDVDLEQTAKCNTDLLHCQQGQDKCRRTGDFERVGQNIGYLGSTGRLDYQRSLNETLNNWFSEIEEMDKNDLTTSPETGEFAQMVWAETTHVGCAMFVRTEATFNHFYLICNYGPAGNVEGEEIYKVGVPCSKCANRRHGCNVRYSGLCGNINEDRWEHDAREKQEDDSNKSEVILYCVEIMMICHVALVIFQF